MSPFRPSTPEDASQIVTLFEEVGFNPNSRPQDLHWKYWRQRFDWAGTRSFVLTDERRIIAHGSAVPGRIAWGDHRASILQVTDWAASPKSPSAGVSLLGRIGALADIHVSVGGSRDTREIMPLIGFEPLCRITGFVRPLRPWRIFASGKRMGWRLAARFLRGLIWKARAPSVELAQCRLLRIGPQQLALLASVFPRPRAGMAVLERSPALFAHALACPMVASELYAIALRGKMRGYVLLTFAPGQARVADIWTQSEDPADWRACIQCAVERAMQHDDVAEIIAWASTPALSARWLECGFHARTEEPVLIRQRGALEIPSTVHLQMLDTDAAYLHHGLPGLWA
ncbi:MAG: hypothetical protein HIU85_18405 [Proteobacteria bacterium]|nr:hypothetical protein [Pseudomonadota bacterium]